MKTYENLIVIYKCNYEKELNPFSSTIINSCFRNTITDKFISIDRVNQFMCEESNEIGKMDAIVIAGSPTIFRPGIGILNEGETIQEAKTLDNTNKGSLKK
uniref:Thioredoxin reductase n=1 Tax=Rhabditophanes sp. KR3021 TaxID=114890 RepID=A0AC35TML9_9BILA